MGIKAFHDGLHFWAGRICSCHVLVKTCVVRWLHILQQPVDRHVSQGSLGTDSKSIGARKCRLELLKVGGQNFLEPFLLRLLLAVGCTDVTGMLVHCIHPGFFLQCSAHETQLLCQVSLNCLALWQTEITRLNHWNHVHTEIKFPCFLVCVKLVPLDGRHVSWRAKRDRVPEIFIILASEDHEHSGGLDPSVSIEVHQLEVTTWGAGGPRLSLSARPGRAPLDSSCSQEARASCTQRTGGRSSDKKLQQRSGFLLWCHGVEISWGYLVGRALGPVC
mmetsp:Transcript_61003/g.98760  ORF Transcript_61003/g.98760 Transcript_61003/m.98760 type:complete len:276 (+) Transcript_61003:371-1198(+)